MNEIQRPTRVRLSGPTRLSPPERRESVSRDVQITKRATHRRDQYEAHGGGGKNLPPRGGSMWWKGALVVMGAILLTTLAIRASDTFDIPGTSLVAGTGASKDIGPCPDGMLFVTTGGGGFCLDRYENSTGDKCRFSSPKTDIETGENAVQELCVPVSVKGREPWVNVTLTQAMTLCARAGKHLASAGEWYRGALGTPDTIENKPACSLNRLDASTAEVTGANQRCVSSYGAYDMVGNVWEWVDADVTAGLLNGTELPEEGYIAEADTNGIPTKTATSGSEIFRGDYFFIDKEGARGVFRGGWWNMAEKAGVYTLSATVPTSFYGSAVGFRCAK
jgi:hypothetical protein